MFNTAEWVKNSSDCLRYVAEQSALSRLLPRQAVDQKHAGLLVDRTAMPGGPTMQPPHQIFIKVADDQTAHSQCPFVATLSFACTAINAVTTAG
jgi:hypothetical protein